MNTHSLVGPAALVLAAALVVTAALGLAIVPPGDLPIHWGITGEADGFAPREVALLLPVGVAALIWGIMWVARRLSPAADFDAGRYAIRAVLSAITGLLLLLEVATVLIGTGVAIGMVEVLTLGIAGLLVVLGNAMPKSQPNGIAGIRLRTTMGDARNWQLTHRLVGLLYLVSGPLLALLVFLRQPAPVLLAGLIAAVLLPIVIGSIYSLRLARQAS